MRFAYVAMAALVAGVPPVRSAGAGEAQFGHQWHRTAIARSQAELIQAASNADVDVIICPQPVDLTDTVDLRDKDVIAGPRVFRFADGGRLLNGRSIARLSPQAKYPIFMDARAGFLVWYTGRVSFDGRKYAPLPGQGTPPSVSGAWNNQVRDVTMWSQFHAGRHSDAIEAAQNSLPGKKALADRFGTIQLPSGTLTLDRPVYCTVGMKIAGNKGPSGAITTLAPGPGFTDPDRLYDLPENFVIVSVPLFIYMGVMLERSGVASALYTMMHRWAGAVRGGLAAGTVFICMIFAAMTGLSGASTVALGLVALPEMLKRHRGRRRARHPDPAERHHDHLRITLGTVRG